MVLQNIFPKIVHDGGLTCPYLKMDWKGVEDANNTTSSKFHCHTKPIPEFFGQDKSDHSNEFQDENRKTRTDENVFHFLDTCIQNAFILLKTIDVPSKITENARGLKRKVARK